ncbi:nucleoside 2-deoxyribosyltransferase [Methanohalobium sp.]|uniref:nucleoside 2-deoxyribosyltransferase n=1 Tax=Methanohalobium sp. TaxID=2837493 RepID=UPI0025E22980|nr:nucleoside 2-deoxyribosyltransferase [Methanohalobium sp.]
MKVFFSGSIRGGRDMLPVYNHICNFLYNNGFRVMSWYVVDSNLEDTESEMSEQEVYNRDAGLIDKSDLLIAEVSVPSIGVGYEICYAISKNLPVICLYKSGSNVSSMVLGNTYDKLIVAQYLNTDELNKIIQNSITSITSEENLSSQ